MINIYDIFARMKLQGQLLVFLLLFYCPSLVAQTPVSYSSSDILQRIQKLKVLGSVLYIAAHPDDENTRLIAWLSKDQLLKTGYLSITRGDGGQNLIGNEQGIELGLIRTQELLAARRIDGGEQFFTSAFDFGYSKSTDEALRFWNKEKVLGDVVWVIRKFRPDVIITRFPPDNRAGHGHHSASAVLAAEAFKVAGDRRAYPEQFKYGVEPWQAKRILWNSYVFGSINTTSPDQMKIEVGGFNPLLGKSYGEIAAESRSQHKSQGFGVPASRGQQLEYFSFTAGNKPKNDLLEGVDLSWKRIGADHITEKINRIITTFSALYPAKSVPSLIELYREIKKLPASYWRDEKLKETAALVAAASGMWMEAFVTKPFVTPGDSLHVNVVLNNRNGTAATFNSFSLNGADTVIGRQAPSNVNLEYSKKIKTSSDLAVSQPYWLRENMTTGSFQINDQQLVGRPQSPPPFEVTFNVVIGGEQFTYMRPVLYKHTDPVEGEVYQPLTVTAPVKQIQQYGRLRHIDYNHIPDIYYYNNDSVRIDVSNVKIAGKKIAYIEGAGDKVPEALSLMGYDVTFLQEKDITRQVLAGYDAVITGVRAFNVHPYLSGKKDILNGYVKDGGNLIVQYNTNSFIGPISAAIGPYPFVISRERITDEKSPVKFLLPEHQVMNFPNKITQSDFNDWVQERGIYFADKLHPAFETPLAMKDPGEEDKTGSLAIASYGKGTFVYTGLVFFRQLPAGVTGAYRLLANIIALNQNPE